MKAQVLRDIRVALAIHTAFVLVVVVFAVSLPESSIVALSSVVFLPQWITFYATSGLDSVQPAFLLIVRCALGICLSFVLSLLYAAAWNSVLFLGGLLICSRRSRATRSV
jgi:hypothetical protein